MKKMKAMAAILTATALIVGGMPDNYADAASAFWFTPDNLWSKAYESGYLPGEIERIETDYGLFNFVLDEGTYIPYMVITESVECGFVTLSHFTVNNLTLYLSPDSGWEAVHEKYKEELDSDYERIEYTSSIFNEGDGPIDWRDCDILQLYDFPEMREVEGTEGEITDFIQYESKADLIAQMCEEMKASGQIVKGSYRDYNAWLSVGSLATYYYEDRIFMPIEIYDETMDITFLQNIAAKYGEGLAVTECTDKDGIEYYELSGVAGKEMLFAICEEIRTDYPYVKFDTEVSIGMSSNNMNTGEVDILTGTPAVNAQMYGDVNQDDAVGINDPSEALSIYAKQAASLAVDEYTADQLFAADADSNGTVDMNDASVILRYYAQTAAGLDPTWDAVLAG